MKFRQELLNKVKAAPRKPGCYIFRDKKDKVLYIGKAVNIRNRVNSYFANYKRIDPKIKVMIEQIDSVEFLITDNELEALILETNLIKKYKPKYNRLMKDDKNYCWLMITTSQDFPKIEFVRKKELASYDYFGPYVNIDAVKRALKRLRRIFPYRTCNRKIYLAKTKEGKKKLYSSNTKPCLYYYINLCDAPCSGSTSRKDYRKNINNIKHFFRSKKFEIFRNLKIDMRDFAESRQYEKAALVRDKIQDLAIISQRIRIEKDMDEKLWKEKKEKSRIEAIKNLAKKLDIDLEKKDAENFRIECYDISNISGKSATGSMVVFKGGKPDKHSYRKFKVKTKDTPDDFYMLKEVFSRRFKRKGKNKDKSFDKKPDLIIVDGGKGQLSSVLKILKKIELKIPTIGLAKKQEEIFQKRKGKFRKRKLRNGSPEFFLIQRIRDEAHRFAIRYHKTLRSKGQVQSVLDDIPGVGDVIKKRLLKAFGSTQGIKKASREDLQSVVKNKRTVENLKKLL